MCVYASAKAIRVRVLVHARIFACARAGVRDRVRDCVRVAPVFGRVSGLASRALRARGRVLVNPRRTEGSLGRSRSAKTPRTNRGEALSAKIREFGENHQKLQRSS